MRSIPFAIAAIVSALCQCPADAAVLMADVLACTTVADANKAYALLAKKDAKGLEALSGPLKASHACLTLARATPVDVDQKQPPLSCVRLNGDLGCYWVPEVLVNLHPAEKSASQGTQGGGGGRGSRHQMQMQQPQ